MMKVLSAFIVMFSAVGVLAMEGQEFIASEHIVSRDGWGAQKAKEGLEYHRDKGFPEGAARIIIGHTVTETGKSILIMQAMQKAHMDRGFADLGYNFCLDLDGECYECRSLDTVPALLQNHNCGTCAVGIIGRFDDHEDSCEISNDSVLKWGKHIAKIAHDLKFKELIRKGQVGANIFGMSELSEKYPISPGIKFLNRFDEIVAIANEELKRLQTK